MEEFFPLKTTMKRETERERFDFCFKGRRNTKKGKVFLECWVYAQKFQTRVGIFALALYSRTQQKTHKKEHKTMSFASVIANRAVLSVAATRAHAKSSNRRSLIVKAEGEEIAETETPAQAPAVSREQDAKILSTVRSD